MLKKHSHFNFQHYNVFATFFQRSVLYKYTSNGIKYGVFFSLFASRFRASDTSIMYPFVDKNIPQEGSSMTSFHSRVSVSFFPFPIHASLPINLRHISFM